ncbi:MAG: alkaline phosphatase PhoX [Cyanobacteria bacterium J06633_23]
MSLNRRSFLVFLGAGAGTVALGSLGQSNPGQSGLKFSMPFQTGAADAATLGKTLSFDPIQLPIPLENGIAPSQQSAAYSTFEVQDDIVVPDGFTYDVIAAWGDPVGDSRFGYNNDYLSLVETTPNEGFLTINFEYISGDTWMETYAQVVGGALPFDQVKAALADTDGEADAFSMADGDPLKKQISAIAKEALTDLGMGVISVKRNAQGQWVRTFSTADRRISGLSGLDNPARLLTATGPATAIFSKSSKMGYDDGFGDKIVGTFQNCAGGTTPWGTVFSAEENFQSQVPEPVMADGSSFDPSSRLFSIAVDMDGSGSVMGFAGNKYGWMVEVDPANPNDYGTKHTWLGRYRHEAVGFHAAAGQKLAVYSGCDRRGGHLYKFVSAGTIRDPKAKINSRLLSDGMLYGAKFNADGTGTWIPLNPDTAVDPVMPSTVFGKDGIGMVKLPNPDRSAGGVVKVTDDAEAKSFAAQFKTLGDLYTGSSSEKQGAILIDAHYAANAAGVTTTARPEDTIVAPDGTLFIAFTSGTPGGDGGPNKQVFVGPNGEAPYEFGWIIKLQETANDPAAMTFTWSKFAMGGEPANGGMGFSNPDNIELDQSGNVWMVTDMSTSKHNQAVPSRMKDGKPLELGDLRGLFGNNSIWFIPTSGPDAGNAYPFGIGPMESECTGPFLTNDEESLFLAVQHPGEKNGVRKNGASEVRDFVMKTTTGEEFMQKRTVPIGSNWPDKVTNAPAKPAVVVVRRQ